MGNSINYKKVLIDILAERNFFVSEDKKVVLIEEENGLELNFSNSSYSVIEYGFTTKEKTEQIAYKKILIDLINIIDENSNSLKSTKILNLI